MTPPAGFITNNEVTGLTRPSKVAWAPDGRRFIAEKDGVLKIAATGATTAQQVLDIRDVVSSFNDRGLLGLAVDSSYQSNGYVYLLFTYDVTGPANGGPRPPDVSAPTVSQLRRYTINASNQVVAGSMRVLLGSYVSGPCPTADNDVDCIPADGDSHSIGTVISAPDGTLFVGNGDGASYSIADPLSLRAYDEASMAGKIMHVDRDGKGLGNHAFCTGDANLDHVCTKLYAKGFRNPFRFNLLPSGTLAVGEVGWGSYEEINLITSGGRSYGWPCYEGPIRTPTWKDRAACAAEYAKEDTPSAHVPPDHSYQHTSAHPSWAVIGGPQYTGTSYPAEYQGRVFFGDYGAGFLKRMTLGSAGSAPVVNDFATDWGSVDLTAAPNGDLVWVDLAGWVTNAGFVERLEYSSNNRKPNAVATANPTSGAAVPLTVAFDGSGSTDPDGDTLSYSWDFDDGVKGSGQKPTHTYTTRGTYRATLTVSDGRGQSDTDTVVINAANTAPVPAIELPAAGSKYRDGLAVSVHGSASDAEDGPLPASAFDWNVRIVHKDHEHLLTSPSGSTAFSFTPLRDHDADSNYVIELSVEDEMGATASIEREIQPETVALHLRSQPPGAPLSYAGTAVSAPWDTPSAIGFFSTVSAAESFTSAGREWRFAGWSSGADRVHDLTVPDAETALTATYTAPPGGSAGGAPDRTGPVITARVGSRRLVLAGVVRDAAGVRSLRLAVAKVHAARCRWLGGSRLALGRPRPCRPRRWVAAQLKGRRWSLNLPPRLPVGRYRVWLLATDRLGNVSRRTADGHAHLSFTVAARASGRAEPASALGRSSQQLSPQSASRPLELQIRVPQLSPDHVGTLFGGAKRLLQPLDLFAR